MIGVFSPKTRPKSAVVLSFANMFRWIPGLHQNAHRAVPSISLKSALERDTELIKSRTLREKTVHLPSQRSSAIYRTKLLQASEEGKRDVLGISHAHSVEKKEGESERELGRE